MKEMGCNRSRLHESVDIRKVEQTRYSLKKHVQLLSYRDDSSKNEKEKKQICGDIFGSFSKYFFFDFFFLY